MTAGDVLRDQALDAVERAADAAWLKAAHLQVDALIRQGQTFSSDEVWSRLQDTGQSTREPRALGPVIRHYLRAGRIELARYEKTVRPSRHSAPVAVWRPVA